jgi:NAD(P)-dependent dehydrogenase (short-subunit alcohol dehydrogenase family)
MSNSVAIVTGASSGIGKATALRLARDFGAIVVAARGGEKLAEVGRRVKAIGAEPLVLELDLMAPTAAEIVVKKTLDRFGRIDALVVDLFGDRGAEGGARRPCSDEPIHRFSFGNLVGRRDSACHAADTRSPGRG